MPESPANPKESPLPVGAERGSRNKTGPLEACPTLEEVSGAVNSAMCWTGESPSGCARGAGAPEGSALLHRYSNNSPKPPTEQGQVTQRNGYRLSSVRTVIRGTVGAAVVVTERAANNGHSNGLDAQGRAWEKMEDGETWELLSGGITSAEAKRAYQLRVNVESFTQHYQHERCGFLTLTAGRDSTITPKQFGEIWDDMRKHGLLWMLSYIRVLEAQKRGAPHYHFVVATPYDLGGKSFDWEALQASSELRKAGDLAGATAATKRYAASAAPELREIWSELRALCRRHGLGRSEFLPFRKEAGAVAHYIGKYLEGGLRYRRDSWKGSRRVEYDRTESKQWKACGSAFGWVSPGATAWRKRVGELARAVRASSPAELRSRLGARWAYHVRPNILTATEPEWRRFLAHLARIYGGKVLQKPAVVVGGEVLAFYPAFDVASSNDVGSVFVPEAGGAGGQSDPQSRPDGVPPVEPSSVPEHLTSDARGGPF